MSFLLSAFVSLWLFFFLVRGLQTVALNAYIVIVESFFRMGHILDKPAVPPTSESVIILENRYITLNTHKPVQAGMGERFALSCAPSVALSNNGLAADRMET